MCFGDCFLLLLLLLEVLLSSGKTTLHDGVSGSQSINKTALFVASLNYFRCKVEDSFLQEVFTFASVRCIEVPQFNQIQVEIP